MQIHTPEWVKHAIFYQIFPDRFARGLKPNPYAPVLEPWEVPPSYQGYKGGDLWGVLERLDYLQDLGVTAIYLNPIFQSASNHRYDTCDYYQVDPLLGGNRAFESLLQEAHRRQIRIILDGVFNHVGRGFSFFHDIIENGPHSPWLHWFHIEGWPLAPYVGDRPANYRGWAGFRSLPQLNHHQPAVREYIMQVAEHWVRLGIDGWRLDVPNCIEVEGFWQEFRQRVKAVNAEAYIVGEIWHDARRWLDGTQFDGVMNYLLTEAIAAFAAGDRIQRDRIHPHAEFHPFPALDAPGYAKKIQALLDLYSWEIQLTQLNLLDSHDTARFLSLVGEDRASVELSMLLLMTFPGAPCIYYGDEVGLPGGIDPDCRRGFPLESEWDRDMLDRYRRLIRLRRDRTALRVGTYHTLYAQGMVYVFARRLAGDEAIVAVNIGLDGATVRLAAGELSTAVQSLTKLYGAGEFTVEEAGMVLEVPGRSGIVVGSI